MKQSLRILALLGVMASQPALAQEKATSSATEPTNVSAAAQDSAASTPAAPSAADLAWSAAEKAMTRGPAQISVEQQATLALPDGYAYVPKLEAQKLLEAWGNGQDSSVEGMIFPTQGEVQNWFLVVSFEKTGFIKDDDAKTWDPAEMLQSMKDGTEQMNEERKERGLPAMHVKEWAEVPRYDDKSHRLVWSLMASTDGETDPQQATINYNTVMLGREGKISMNMVTSVADLPVLRPIANNLLGQLEFVKGKTYADFDESTDHVAEYGLAALVAGGLAAKKLGLFALAAAFFAKFAKLFIAAFVAIGYGIKKFLGREKNSPAN